MCCRGVVADASPKYRSCPAKLHASYDGNRPNTDTMVCGGVRSCSLARVLALEVWTKTDPESQLLIISGLLSLNYWPLWGIVACYLRATWLSREATVAEVIEGAAVAVTPIQPGDFLILGTDGLWPDLDLIWVFTWGYLFYGLL